MKKKVIILGTLVFAFFGLWTAGWFVAADQIRQQVLALAQKDPENEPRLTCGTFAVGGFPFRFDLDCTSAELDYGDETITLAGLRASVMVYNPTHLLFSAKAPYAMANAFTGSASRFDFGMAEGSARFVTGDLFKGLTGAGWRIGRISLVIDNLVWNDTVISDVLQAKADHIEAHLLDIPEQFDKEKGLAALATYAEVKGLEAPAFNIKAAQSSFESEISGLPDDLLVLAQDPDPLHNWQRRGGVFKLVRFAGDQPDPDENFEVSGQMSLTDAGLVNAQLSYKGKNVLDRFARFIPPIQLAAIKGAQQPDGSFANSLTMIDGKLKLLTFSLMDVPPLW